MTIQEEIKDLKEKKQAVILAHYYTRPEVQEIADYTGDSFYLSKMATKLENSIIVYCGVAFMGESGSLLNPNKKILMPDKMADCPMAHMVVKDEIDNIRKKYEDLVVVCYINSTAQVKSWCDVSVTSANAVQIIKNIPNKNILIVPDKNLGRFVAAKIPEKNVMYVQGYCPIHEHMSIKEIQELKQLHSEAEILAHPECCEEVINFADYVGSTSGIIEYVSKSNKSEWIICTEIGILYELQKENPNKQFYFPKTKPVCIDMKKITLEKILQVLKEENNQAIVKTEMSKDAKQTLNRMLELAK